MKAFGIQKLMNQVMYDVTSVDRFEGAGCVCFSAKEMGQDP